MRAGRKNAITSQMMMGVQMIMPKNSATLKRMVKPPSAVRTVRRVPSGSAPRMGSIIMSMSVGVAKYTMTAVTSTDTITMVMRRRSSPR